MPDTVDFARLQTQFSDYMREPSPENLPEGLDPARMELYKNLVFNNIHNILCTAFPIIFSILSEAQWDALVRDFIAEHAAQTPIFHFMAREFVTYLCDERDNPSDPPWLYELAHYEWLEVALGFSNEDVSELNFSTPQDWLKERPVISPLMQVQCYRFPVHRMGRDFHPNEAPEEPSYLIVYRHHDEKVRFMHINAFTAYLLNVLLESENALTSEEALERVIHETNHPNPAMVINGGVSSLNSLYLAGIILGTH